MSDDTCPTPEAVLTHEWRKTVMDDLRELKNGQKEVVQSVNELGLKLAQSLPNGQSIKELEARVRTLENDKFKVTGIVIALNGMFGIGLAVFELLKHSAKP